MTAANKFIAKPKKLPYGLSNFARMIEQNYAYVDKTRYIELLENENNPTQFFIRPRRFGKSLFLSILENYYDLNAKSRFDELFGNLYIGKNPTAEQGSYTILRFDFSGLDTENHEVFKKTFSDAVQEQVINYFEKYKHIFTDMERAREKGLGIGALNVVYTAADNSKIPVFVLIDEYDHFANNLIAMGKSYTDEVKAGGTVRAFYESLKKGTSSAVKRIFMTGISPMMINDLTSGFNIATDYSLFHEYNEMFGFTSEEVEWLMEETGVDKTLINFDIEAFYNGYMFSEYGKNKVYNSQMILYLFNQVLRQRRPPKQIIDTNLQTDYARLRRLAENPNNRERLFDIVLNGGVTANIIEKFSLEQLNRDEYFISLLFYMGLLTVGGMDRDTTRLIIPNYSIKTLYWGYMAEYFKNTEEGAIDTEKLSETIRNMAYEGDIAPFLNYFSENFLKRLSNRDLQKFDEKYIKAMMLTLLFITPLYLPVSEYETVSGYTDIYLQKHPEKRAVKYEHVFEIKYVKTDTTDVEAAARLSEAESQIEKYRKDGRFAGREDIQFAAMVFKGKGDVEWKRL